MNKKQKMYSMTERHIEFIKKEATLLDIAESDMLRRILDEFIKISEKETKDKVQL